MVSSRGLGDVYKRQADGQVERIPDPKGGPGVSLHVTLLREEQSDQGTFGLLSFEGHELRSLELPWRGNQRGLSCIPEGIYRCVMVRSPRMGRVYGVCDVPGRSNVLIHSANLAGDIHLGWDTQLQGCIAPYKARCFLLNLSLIHISEPTRRHHVSRMPSSA